MLFSLILLFLLLGITLRQATQGFFSALIMAVLSVCCATTALCTYEWVAIHVLAKHWKPDYAMGVSLGLTFGVSLSVLYTVFAMLVKRRGLLPLWADRIGGGVCGFVTAMTMVGVLALSLQMMPFPLGSILGYTRIYAPDPLEVADPAAAFEGQNELILQPDRFVVGLASVLSHGTFSGTLGFFEHNPDLVQAIAWNGATASTVSRFAPPESISIDATSPLEFVYKMAPADDRRGVAESFDPELAAEGHEFRMIRVLLHESAKDSNQSHIFTLRQFRLVGRVAGETIDRQYHAIAIQEDPVADGAQYHVRQRKLGGSFVPVSQLVYTPGTGGSKVELVFELPKSFTPAFVEYKRAARASLTFTSASYDDQIDAPSVRTASATPSSNAAPVVSDGSSGDNSRGSSRPSGRRSRRRGGNVRGVAAQEGGSKFSDEFPFPLKTYQRFQNVDISNEKLVSGRLSALLDEQSDGAGSGAPVSKFLVPEDKRLLQLQSTRLRAGSAFGQALSFAATTVQNYFVQDAAGNRYTLAGKYAIAKVGGKKTFEVQYFSEPVGSIGGIGKFNRIDEKKLTKDDQFVLLFLVKPGAHIVSFSTGGSATRKDDLLTENLIAPK